MHDLTIGKIAKQVSMSCDTIRMYERQGLIEEPERAANGYRMYSKSVITQLHFIKRAKTMGFSLKEIGELLAIKQHSSANICNQVRAEMQIKLQNIENKIAELKRLKKAIGILIRACKKHHGNHHCPLLNALERENHKGSQK